MLAQSKSSLSAFTPAILTLNPCIDKCVYLPTALKIGSINRVERSIQNVAGKGLNQALLLRNLGVSVNYFSFGSPDGDASDAFIESQNIRYHKTPAKAGIRTNLKIIDADGVGTEINEKGGPITQNELAAILAAVEAHQGNILSVCGSIPQGAEMSVYRDVLARAKEQGKITVLDADGDALKLGLQACPDYIKPNRRELAGLCNTTEGALADENEVIRHASRIVEQYGTTVLCTMDEHGSLYVGRDGVWRVGVAKYPLRGFSGAGDTYLASFLYARYADHADITTALSFAARASAAKIALDGTDLPTRQQIEAVPQVEVTRL
jgi:1-phosphofructokinase family hexose kinase